MKEGLIGMTTGFDRKTISLAFNLRIVAAVAQEFAGRGKLTQLVADHVFRHEHGDEILAVVDQEGVADEIGRDH